MAARLAWLDQLSGLVSHRTFRTIKNATNNAPSAFARLPLDPWILIFRLLQAHQAAFTLNSNATRGIFNPPHDNDDPPPHFNVSSVLTSELGSTGSRVGRKGVSRKSTPGVENALLETTSPARVP